MIHIFELVLTLTYRNLRLQPWRQPQSILVALFLLQLPIKLLGELIFVVIRVLDEVLEVGTVLKPLADLF